MNSTKLQCSICKKVYKEANLLLQHLNNHIQQSSQNVPYPHLGQNHQMIQQYSVTVQCQQYSYTTSSVSMQAQYSLAQNVSFLQYPMVSYNPMTWNNTFLPNEQNYAVNSMSWNNTFLPNEQNCPLNPTNQTANESKNSENTILKPTENDLNIFSSNKENEENQKQSSTTLNEQNNKDELRPNQINDTLINNIENFTIPNDKDELLFEDFATKNYSIFMERIKNNLLHHNIIKFKISIVVEYLKIIEDDMDVSIITHAAKMNLLMKEDDIHEMLVKQFKEIYRKMCKFEKKNSDCSLIRLIRAEINVNESSLLKDSHYISSPEKLALKRACINIENNDNYCFKWAVISGMDTTIMQNFQRCSSYNISDISADIISLQNNIKLDFSLLTFPLKLNDIKIFESKNSNISINIFGYDEETDEVIGPFYLTQQEKVHHLNLLLLENAYGHHYILIKNMSRLFKNQITKNSRKLLICNICLYYTHSEIAMSEHRNKCGKNISEMPTSTKRSIFR